MNCSSVLKQAKIPGSITYLRDCLPERYKDPTKRHAALQRKDREGANAGVPIDTGLTTEELEARLNRKPKPTAKFTVKTELKYIGTKTLKSLINLHKEDIPAPDNRNNRSNLRRYVSTIPIIVHVEADTQEIFVIVDKEEYNKRIGDPRNLLD